MPKRFSYSGITPREASAGKREARVRQIYADLETRTYIDVQAVNEITVYDPVVIPFRPDPRRHPHTKVEAATERYDPSTDLMYGDRTVAVERAQALRFFAAQRLAREAVTQAVEALPYMNLIDTADAVIAFATAPTDPHLALSGWTKTGVCGGGGGNGWSGTPGTLNGSLANTCLGLQAGTYFSNPSQLPATWQGLIKAQWDADKVKYTHMVNWSRTLPAKTAPTTQITTNVMANPNVARFANVTPQPLPDFLPAATSVATVQRARVIQSTTGGGPPPSLPRTRQAHKSKKPDKFEKQAKPKSRQIIAKLLKGIDWSSERLEDVDSIYKALPKDVQRRWNRPDRPGDSFGQYGLSGADWKLQAIYYNWDKIDWNKAGTDMVLNRAKDKLYGVAYAAKDNLTRGKYLDGSRYGGKTRRRKRFG